MTSISLSSPLKSYPVILSGGKGTRLWPISTASKPKQFLSILSDHTLIQETALRIGGAPIMVSSEAHADLVAQQMSDIGRSPAAILLEPEGRNTAAAIAIAAHWIVARDGDGLMLVMPSDQAIADLAAFRAAIRHATPAALDGHLVTFGIQPTYAETGYGYIEMGGALAEHSNVHGVAKFVEKPDAETAQAYLTSGRHYWNGGIFLFTARSYLDALEKYAPAVADATAKSMNDAAVDGLLVRPERAAFLASPSISIDYAVMERTEQAAVVRVDMGWSDVGSWNALWSMGQTDSANNVVHGRGAAIAGTGNIVYVDGGPPVAAYGMTDCVIASTAGAILVMPKQRSQEIGKIAEWVAKQAWS